MTPPALKPTIQCKLCLSVGTIVDLGACCRIKQMSMQDSAPAKLESRGSLSRNDSDTKLNERRSIKHG